MEHFRRAIGRQPLIRRGTEHATERDLIEMLELMLLRHAKSSKAEPAGEWEEWLWYDAETVPSIETIKPRIQKWLNEAVEELAVEVLG